MNAKEIIQSIDTEISRLQHARALLSSGALPTAISPKKSRKNSMSESGRAAIAAAQKRRWAKLKNKKG